MLKHIVCVGIVCFPLVVMAQQPQPIVPSFEYWNRLEKTVKEELRKGRYEEKSIDTAWSEIKERVKLSGVRASIDPCFFRIKRWAEQETCWSLLTEQVKPIVQGYIKTVSKSPELAVKDVKLNDNAVDMSDNTSHLDFLGKEIAVQSVHTVDNLSK